MALSLSIYFKSCGTSLLGGLLDLDSTACLLCEVRSETKRLQGFVFFMEACFKEHFI